MNRFSSAELLEALKLVEKAICAKTFGSRVCGSSDLKEVLSVLGLKL